MKKLTGQNQTQKQPWTAPLVPGVQLDLVPLLPLRVPLGVPGAAPPPRGAPPAMAWGSAEYSCTSTTQQSRAALSFFSLEAEGATRKRPWAEGTESVGQGLGLGMSLEPPSSSPWPWGHPGPLPSCPARMGHGTHSSCPLLQQGPSCSCILPSSRDSPPPASHIPAAWSHRPPRGRQSPAR